MEKVLWNGRASIWQSVPPLPPAHARLLESYFAGGRTTHLRDLPAPRWGRLAALVLNPAGSAPGIDGEPYEAYHPGS
eukprot:2262684-Pyramimonas_sp.AAC.1